MAVISLDLASVATWPSAIPSSVAQALALGADRLVETVLPEVVRQGDGWVFRYPRSRTGTGG